MTDGEAPVENASNFGHDSHFVRRQDTLWRQVAGAILVRTVADAEIFELNGSGVLLWIALEDPVTADELIAELAGNVGAPAELVAVDVRAALGDLLHRGLVTRGGVA